MKLLTIIGARPQFIKAAAVSRKLRTQNEEIIVHTGQHYDDNMSKVFFDELEIPMPDYNLNVGSGSHGTMTGNMMIKIEEVMLKEKPDCVIVYGDTNSTLAGGVCASKLLIPLAHIEAGLRSFNKKMPEEQNRILTDHVSSFLFTPTETAVENLKNEGIINNVYNVGDVMYDACLHYLKIAEKRSTILEKLNLNKGEYILGTVHRAENTNDPLRLKNIVRALNESGAKIVLPLHPRTKKYLKQYNLSFSDNIKIIDAVGYHDTLVLEKNCRKIVTDSGGIQKEAYFMKKPCITLRDESEWVETIKSGWNILAGADYEKITNAIQNFEKNGEQINYYGNGKASEGICNILKENL
ncbi:non-hydrolyzing UDP-N-acetylglucosamine 2-epimerase [Oceanirhabdus sp. W0125-5]|uniref:non-hydrolyzing UDP-N-acetylglucosamine 2-epimerase n=1 Tax=Oceanirhabdus sp. W0125-5 TaxID=2999116 RepID=UPI0022F304E7|nr:UDP-N-acetylglucosamine 2-epimerase (non-hydrolyzing) [Oceanirhabdus sp. W0125-5]WBW99447.1 UDP-N-acetylglucosamine 2-epimerase (non-hydrolyzing) [Oceanirhabdus sp. W0125-5]